MSADISRASRKAPRFRKRRIKRYACTSFRAENLKRAPGALVPDGWSSEAILSKSRTADTKAMRSVPIASSESWQACNTAGAQLRSNSAISESLGATGPTGGCTAAAWLSDIACRTERIHPGGEAKDQRRDDIAPPPP
eukprot:9006995-Alexandrium_andersonii.AAC.1